MRTHFLWIKTAVVFNRNTLRSMAQQPLMNIEIKGNSPEQTFFKDIVYAQAAASNTRAPWDIQRAQPALERAIQCFSGAVLDVGCGLGDNSRWLATLPSVTSVLGVDLAPAAVTEARARGSGVGPAPVAFEERDVFLPETIAPIGSVDTLLDSAVFHCIGDDDKQRHYLKSITPMVRLGGRAVLLVFSSQNPEEGWRGPRRIAPEHAREFWEAAGWRVDTLEDDARYLDIMGRCDGKGGHALLMTATRIA